MVKRPIIFLNHILESIELIENYIKGVTYQEFIDDIGIQDKIIRRLEIIGEAVRNLPPDFRQKYSDINWQGPADMRSALIHGYFEADTSIIWDTITQDLPPFKKQIRNLLETLTE